MMRSVNGILTLILINASSRHAPLECCILREPACLPRTLRVGDIFVGENENQN
jgi:hypothetical protein